MYSSLSSIPLSLAMFTTSFYRSLLFLPSSRRRPSMGNFISSSPAPPPSPRVVSVILENMGTEEPFQSPLDFRVDLDIPSFSKPNPPPQYSWNVSYELDIAHEQQREILLDTIPGKTIRGVIPASAFARLVSQYNSNILCNVSTISFCLKQGDQELLRAVAVVEVYNVDSSCKTSAGVLRRRIYAPPQSWKHIVRNRR